MDAVPPFLPIVMYMYIQNVKSMSKTFKTKSDI